MKKKIQSSLKKQLFIFVALSPLFASALEAPILSSESNTPKSTSLNAAPPSFPTAAQAFKKISLGELSVSDSQTQPWFESYDQLYKKINKTTDSDQAITLLLNELAQKKITAEDAGIQFQAAQEVIKTTADSILTS